MTDKQKGKGWWSWSNLITGLAVVFVAALLFVPGFKTTVIKSLMKVGLFQPGIKKIHVATPLSNHKANDILFRNDSGNVTSLAQLKGKVVFINVWATWCGPCKAELPAINTLKKEMSDIKDLKIITLNSEGEFKKAKAFMKQQQLDLPIWVAVRKFPKFLSSKAIPYTVVLNKEGYLVYQHTGTANYNSDKFKRFLKHLANES